jgi:hypothetical protein
LSVARAGKQKLKPVPRVPEAGHNTGLSICHRTGSRLASYSSFPAAPHHAGHVVVLL